MTAVRILEESLRLTVSVLFEPKSVTAEDAKVGADVLFNSTLPYLAWAHQHIHVSIHFFTWYCFRQGLFNPAKYGDPILPFEA